jgi:hypothetical protein
MYTETDPRVLAVLERALRSTSRATRRRAVGMLARVECTPRERWLAVARKDVDAAVRETAVIVTAWVAPGDGQWPDREDPAFDRAVALDSPRPEGEAGSGWRWEYAVEIWREDGLLVGVYLAVACQEDDEHAKRVALGQAILGSSSQGGEQFDPSTAAAFIVGKRRVFRGPDARSP